MFTYTDTVARVYVDILDLTTGAALYAEPGKSYDLAADPADGRWVAGDVAPEAPQSTPEAPETPAEPAPDQTPSK